MVECGRNDLWLGWKLSDRRLNFGANISLAHSGNSGLTIKSSEDLLVLSVISNRERGVSETRLKGSIGCKILYHDPSSNMHFFLLSASVS